MASPSSSECLAKIQAYETAKGSVTGVYGYVEDCKNAVSLTKPYMEEVVISGKCLDDGKMAVFSAKLATVLENLQAIVAECDQKISEWKIKYQHALEEEEKERLSANV